MNIKRCAVTGTRGYLGSRVVQYFRRQGWSVVEMSRGVGFTEFTIPYSLLDEIKPDALRGLNALIHCAHDFSVRTKAEMEQVNVAGSLRLLHAAKEARVDTVVLISTMAAFEGCRSLYGQAKLAIEHEAARQGAVIVRPGAIYGKQAGGLIGSMRQAVAKLPVVPLIGNGKYPVYMAHEDDLCELLVGLCTKRLTIADSKPISAAARQPVLFRQLLKELASAAGRHPVFIPVPWQLLLWGLWVAEACGLKLGLRSDSIVSLVNYNVKPDFSVTEQTGLCFREFSAQEL